MRPELYQKEFWNEYVEMGQYKLEVYDHALLEFDLSRSQDCYDKLLAELHSLKGVSATIGVDVMVKTCHEVETILIDFYKSQEVSKRDIPEELSYVKIVLSKVIEEQQHELLDDDQMKQFLFRVGAWKEDYSESGPQPEKVVPVVRSEIDSDKLDEPRIQNSREKAQPVLQDESKRVNSEVEYVDEPMIQLMYLSKKSDDLRLMDVMDFSRKAKVNNAEKNITGMLIYFKGSFFQMLEGPITEVNKLYDKINRDPRHKDIVLLNVQTIYSRRFPKWSLNNISSSSYQALRELMVQFGMVDEDVAFPMNYELLNLMVDKLRKNPEGVYH